MKRSVIEEVWTPTQHIALWLGAWITGYEGYDHVLDAIGALGGPGALLHDAVVQPLELVDAVIPEDIVSSESVSAAEFLQLVRAVTRGAQWTRESEPPVRLILSGAGDPPQLPAGSAGAKAAAAAGAAIVISDAEPLWSHVIIPAYGDKPWQWFSMEGILPQPHHLSAGEADYVLAEATRSAAATIAALNPGGLAGGAGSATSFGSSAKPDPRLMVGMLDDHFDVAHIPDAVPRRAASLVARADTLAAILTVAQGTESLVGSGTFDPQLIPLWRNIRMARMTAVDYAVREWATN